MSSDHHDDLPRIVSETPIGGKPRPLRPPLVPTNPGESTPDTMPTLDELASAETPMIDEPAANVTDEPAVEMPSAPVEAELIPASEIVTPIPAAEIVTDEPAAEAPSAPVESTPAAEIVAPIPAAEIVADELAAETLWPEESTPAAEIVAPVPSSKSTSPVEAPPAAVPPSKVTWNAAPGEPVADRSEWDDDLSPELAAVLFGGGQPTAARPSASVPSAAPATPASPAPEAIVEPPAEPITLTDVAGARTLPITAHEISSPAPETLLTGKARYTRIEEPLLEDQGQRTVEKWEYLKSDWPSLVGRLVRRVYIEEVSFADGSWRWVYERSYSDNGKDRREVRANKDHTLIERTDEIAKKDPATGKGIRRKEFAAMILAAPASTEKPGFFSRLLGKKAEEPTGPTSWRPALSDEIRVARKRGGSAF